MIIQNLVEKVSNLVTKDFCLHFIVSVVLYAVAYHTLDIDWALIISFTPHILRKIHQVILGRRDWGGMLRDILAGGLGTITAYACTLPPAFIFLN